MQQGQWKKNIGIGLAVMILSASSAADSQTAKPLFSFQGKVYNEADLSTTGRQSLYDLEIEHHEKMKRLLETTILDLYLEQQATKQKKKKADVEAKLLAVKEPTDKEVSKFYEENKARIPYPLEQIKGEILQLLKSQGIQEARAKLVEKVKSEGKVEVLLAEPIAPLVEINTEGSPEMGDPKAKVTLVEFADYQCPHCKTASESLKRVMNKYKDRVRFVFMDFPVHPSGISRAVAEGSVCARDQGKYWEYHDLAFAKQRELTMESQTSLAKDLKLDEAAFKACIESGKAKKAVDAAYAEGTRVGVTGTPAIYLNGRRVHMHSDADLIQAVERALKGAA